MITPVNRKILLALHAQLIKQGVKYGYGAKAEGGSDPRNGHRWNPRSTHKLSTPINTIQNIDCSGIIRYGAYQATGGKLVLPDGSVNQRGWCEDNLHEVHYSEAARHDNVLRIAFLTPGKRGVGSIGHVIWTFNGNTLESYGGHGVGSHRWVVYAPHVHKCFVMPSVSGVDSTPIETQKHNPPILVLQPWDKPLQGAYLTNGYWNAPDTSLAYFLGYATQNPALHVNVLERAREFGWALDDYTQRLNERGRADMRLMKV